MESKTICDYCKLHKECAKSKGVPCENYTMVVSKKQTKKKSKESK